MEVYFRLLILGVQNNFGWSVLLAPTARSYYKITETGARRYLYHIFGSGGVATTCIDLKVAFNNADFCRAVAGDLHTQNTTSIALAFKSGSLYITLGGYSAVRILMANVKNIEKVSSVPSDATPISW